MTVRFNMPRVSAFNATGVPRGGAKLYFYEPTTLTPKDVFSDPALDPSDVIAQPVVANSAGLWETIFCSAALYRVILKDSNNVTIWDEDNYDPGLAAGFGVSSVVGVAQGGTGATNAASARANLAAASSEALTAVQNTVTEHTTLIETGLHTDGDRFGALAAEDEVTRALMAAGTGSLRLQRVESTTVSDSSVTASIPFDTSIPQVGEGEQIMSLAITPLSSASTVEVKAFVTYTQSTTPITVVLAMFRNGAANSVAADGKDSAHSFNSLELEYIETPGSTSTITYTLRLGASTGTVTIPGSNNLGAVRKCRIVAEEWIAV